MGFLDSLMNSLRLPKKEAMFRLNRKGITHTIGYLFILLALLFLPDMVATIVHMETNLTEISRGRYVVQFLVFYPLLIIFIILVGISLLAAASMLLRRVLSRKLIYQQLWKLSAYAVTLPLILSVVLKYMEVPDRYSALLFLIIFGFFMYKMIIVYPKVPAKA
ncbi:DUF1189 family protein [Halobacillus sp. ACCC02827]|uniref:DUF1189 family protein n=1 Tax=Bacillaceae TaxID=186817 RepID=UPI000412C7B1|nr:MULTISPECIES: DUF1189 family protein [Bacillaceae]QHT45241.1 DUF1189 domain-containing protein [Bacillus sp. SB49]WJE16020.1 DUF1189 family protein [Halobacillus sp. ACCC02827]